ncbi:MAG: ATP-binding protein, partial [Polyangiales bacterium]
ILFSDTGEGMDTQVRSRARTPFFTTRAEGTGLGLAICERIVTAHGGLMEITSRKGEGTTVSVFLVAGTADGPSPRSTASENPESQRSSWLEPRTDGLPSPLRLPGLLPSMQPLIAEPRSEPPKTPPLERTGEHE